MIGRNFTGYAILIISFCIVTALLLFFLRRYFLPKIKEDEQGILFRFGRFYGTYGSGPIGLIPFVDHLVRVPISKTKLDFPNQPFPTKDGNSVLLDIVITILITDPERVILKIGDYESYIGQLARDFLEAEILLNDFRQVRFFIRSADLLLHDVFTSALEEFGIKIEDITIVLDQG